jgi:hypothetical protein
MQSSKKLRHDMSVRQIQVRSRDRDPSLAIVLFCVVITFLLCNVLALIVNLMECMWKKRVVDIENLSNFLITLNSSANFAIYCVFGQKFRTELMQLWNEIIVSSKKRIGIV